MFNKNWLRAAPALSVVVLPLVAGCKDDGGHDTGPGATTGGGGTGGGGSGAGTR